MDPSVLRLLKALVCSMASTTWRNLLAEVGSCRTDGDEAVVCMEGRREDAGEQTRAFTFSVNAGKRAFM